MNSTMTSTESIPVLHIRAKSNYEVGFVTGKTFKGWVQEFLNVSEEVKLFREFYSTSDGKKLTEGYLDVSKKSHPKIVSEIQGIADGSEVSFNDIFLLQLASEILFCHSKEILKKPPNPSHEGLGCTDVLVNRTKARVIGHNDDWHKDVVDFLFSVHVTITDDKDNVVEQFISFCYPGFLAGFGFGMNKSLVITHNTLIPRGANISGVPIGIIMRSLYACTSREEVLTALENKPFGCAYATATHIARIESTEMCSLELHPNQGKLEINVFTVPHESQDDECYYCHQNYYKQIKGADSENCRGSYLRDKRASELFPVKDIEDVKAILGDTKEDFEPIYRKSSDMESTESIPVLYIRAKSNYDVGFVIGKTFRSWIKDYLQDSTSVKLFRDFYSTSEGKKVTEGYLDISKKSHPKIVSEIQGIADGAQVSFNDIFLLQLASEILFCHSKEILKKPPNPSQEGIGCTDLLVNRKNARIMGHNDDWYVDVVDRVFMAHVTITDDKDNIVEQFISFSYPGYLMGFCFGMNKSLVITLNTLIPKNANTNSVPVAILLRALFECSTVEECVTTMENKPFGCSYAMCIDVATIEGTEMCSLELYPNQGKLEINIYKVPHESQDDECYYCHQNYYKQIKGADSENCRGSHLRDKRASELFPVKDIEDVKAILGDTKEDFEPIYRKARPDRWSPTVETSATAIFDITNRVLHVYRSNPKLASSPCLTLPFL